jgi:(1->4)-alpha-D-glucan 1-alpha-D-glucosylmutase
MLKEADRCGDDGDLAVYARSLVAAPEDGRVKLYVTRRSLELRQRLPQLFQQGGYQPLSAGRERADHVVAYARSLESDEVIAAAPRLLTRLATSQDLPLGASAWSTARLLLPGRAGRRYRDVFTGRTHVVDESTGAPGVALADLYEHFPLALLERTH